MGRRFFAALVGSAPVAGAVVARPIAQQPANPYPHNYIGMERVEQTRPPSPLELLSRSKQKKFHAFRETLDNQNSAWNNMNYGHTSVNSFPVSIDVLKSVTTQHKLRMMHRLHAERRKKHDNAMSQFAKLLGWETEYESWRSNSGPVF